jgi:hypothetical protein
MKNNDKPEERLEESKSPRPAVVKSFPSFILTAVIFPLVFLGLGGNWRWTAGWIFALWFDAMVLFSMGYMVLKDPALLAERSRSVSEADNQKKWDRYLLLGVYALAILWFVIMPLDAERFHWSPPFPLWIKIIGALALIPA